MNQLEADVWQPIETAPKDGRKFVYLKSEQSEPDALFLWSRKNKRWETTLFAIARSVDGWWSEDAEPPTHWRPLPEPPVQP